jgi:GNAT superfamily N-acetyltransferase
VRPWHVLSTGQKFRATLARLLAVPAGTCDPPADPIVFDEFTSVVDRTVAKVGSAALAKTVRARGLRFVAVTCHEDVTDWLQPDWLYRADAGEFTRRCLCPRPPVDLELTRTTAAAWPLFAPHHYLSHALSPGAACFLAFARLPGEAPRPAAFSAWLNHLSAKGGKREHRTVVLPDFQGVGIGMTVSSLLASMWKALGFRASSTTTHPAFVAARRRSPDWRMTRPPSLGRTAAERFRGGVLRHAATRLTAGFEYVGPAMDTAAAVRLRGE